VINKAANKQQHDGRKMKVLMLKESIEEVLGQLEGVNMNLSGTEEAVGPWASLLERATLELAETRDWTSRIDQILQVCGQRWRNRSGKVEKVQ
jgi:hypothetical protein